MPAFPKFCLMAATLLALAAMPADAAELLKMSSDRSLLVRLPADAKTVVVANPTHLTVLLENPRLMVLVPGQSGTTSLTVLDRRGETIFDRDVVISPIGPRQVRVTRACAVDGAQASGCAPTTVLDCTDGCVTVSAPPAAAPMEDGSIGGSGQGGMPAPPSNANAADQGITDPVGETVILE